MAPKINIKKIRMENAYSTSVAPVCLLGDRRSGHSRLLTAPVLIMRDIIPPFSKAYTALTRTTDVLVRAKEGMFV
jgi:hypothetical protein